MDIFSVLTLFVIMLSLAALPSSSVALVVTRAATHGVSNGIAVAGGIVVGDLIFVALALLGMSVIAETMGTLFALLRCVGGAYLIWIGFSILCSKASLDLLEVDSTGSSLAISALAGLTLTLGDLKAILFYASLFPTLFNVATLSITDVSLIVTVTILTVGGVKVTYALISRRIVTRFSDVSVSRPARTIAGGFLMGTGAYIIAKG